MYTRDHMGQEQWQEPFLRTRQLVLSTLSAVCDLCAEDSHTKKAWRPKATKEGSHFHVLNTA